MTIVELLIYGAATWRIASLFVQESGPFNVFTRIRELAGIHHDDEGNVLAIPDNFFGELLSCVWCSSLWAALFWGIVAVVFPAIALKTAMVFAFSTIAVLIDKWLSA